MNESFLIFGGIQGFVFGAALLTIKPPKNPWTNRLFSLLIFTVALFLLISSQIEHFPVHPKFFLAAYVLIYLYCPLYNLFVQSLALPQFRFSRIHFINLLPATFYMIALGRWLIMSNEEIRSLLLQGAHLDLTLMDLVSIGVNLYFIWASWKLTKNTTSQSLPYSRNWAFTFLNASLLVANSAWLLVVLRQLGLPVYLPVLQLSTVYTSMSVMIFAFGYFLVANSRHFSIAQIVQNIKYRNVALDEDKTKELERKIIYALETRKPFKNAEFSLQDLASLSGVDKGKVSYIINNSLNTNFTSLVNKYRVEEFIKIVDSEDYSKYSLLGIAQEAGFKSKSTFYKAFKEINGKTPREYFENMGSLEK